MNIAYHDLENAIVDRVGEDYFWDIFTTDTVVDQNEYTHPVNSATVEWIKKIQRAEVKWSATDDYHTLLRLDTIKNYDYSDWYLQAYMEEWNGLWEVREWSIFIYPKPSEAVSSGLKMHAIVSLIDLVSWGAETTIFPWSSELRQYHHLVSLWAIPRVERYRDSSLQNQIQWSMLVYESEKNKMIKALNARTDRWDGSLPDMEYYY